MSRARIGEVRQRGDGSSYRKVAEGKWEPVKEGGGGGGGGALGQGSGGGGKYQQWAGSSAGAPAAPKVSALVKTAEVLSEKAKESRSAADHYKAYEAFAKIWNMRGSPGAPGPDVLTTAKDYLDFHKAQVEKLAPGMMEDEARGYAAPSGMFGPRAQSRVQGPSSSFYKDWARKG